MANAQEDLPPDAAAPVFQNNPHLRPPQNTKFRNAINAIVSDLDKQSPSTHSISQLHSRHQIKRRRLYDVLNVFTAVGCATRPDSEAIVWQGRNRIFPELTRAKIAARIDSPQLSLALLFPPDNCVSLSSLTVSFVLLFAAIRVEVLDVRRVSSFFSRDIGRYKTTLCKLYQIALILGALDVTERHCNVCEIKIVPPYTQLLAGQQEDNPLSIPNLLNHPDEKTFIEERRAEFEKFLIPHGNRY
jgi:hypothetical protein